MSIPKISCFVTWALPSAIALILAIDLIKNQSLVTQYFHWISFIIMGLATAALTGKSQITFNLENMKHLLT